MYETQATRKRERTSFEVSDVVSSDLDCVSASAKLIASTKGGVVCPNCATLPGKSKVMDSCRPFLNGVSLANCLFASCGVTNVLLEMDRQKQIFSRFGLHERNVAQHDAFELVAACCAPALDVLDQRGQRSFEDRFARCGRFLKNGIANGQRVSPGVGQAGECSKIPASIHNDEHRCQEGKGRREYTSGCCEGLAYESCPSQPR